MTRDDLNKIILAVQDCFPNTSACNGALLVSMYRYNKLVEVVNELAAKEDKMADLP